MAETAFFIFTTIITPLLLLGVFSFFFAATRDVLAAIVATACAFGLIAFASIPFQTKPTGEREYVVDAQEHIEQYPEGLAAQMLVNAETDKFVSIIEHPQIKEAMETDKALTLLKAHIPLWLVEAKANESSEFMSQLRAADQLSNIDLTSGIALIGAAASFEDGYSVSLSKNGLETVFDKALTGQLDALLPTKDQ